MQKKDEEQGSPILSDLLKIGAALFGECVRLTSPDGLSGVTVPKSSVDYEPLVKAGWLDLGPYDCETKILALLPDNPLKHLDNIGPIPGRLGSDQLSLSADITLPPVNPGLSAHVMMCEDQSLEFP